MFFLRVFLICTLSFFILPGFSHAKKKSKKKKTFRYETIVINRKSESRKKTDMRPVIFTHLEHAKKYRCKACHPKVFIPRRGANNIDMQKNAEGEFCGKCHNGRAAWSLLKCDVCHSGDPVADENAAKYAE